MTLRRTVNKIRSTIAAAGLLAACLVGATAPAQAAPPAAPAQASALNGIPNGYALNLETGAVEKARAGCPSGSICFYNYNNGTGLLEQVSASIRDRSVCYALPALSSNRTSYIVNSTGYVWFVFDGGSCQTTPGHIYAWSQGAMGGQFDNSITSYFKS